MATTALFVEIIVVGLETAVWLLVLILGIRGISVEQIVNELKDLKEFATPLTTSVLAVAYVLGVITDRVSDSLYDWFRHTPRRIKRWAAKKSRKLEKPKKPKKPTVSHMRLTVMQKNAEIAKFLDYQRTRLRIARGTVVNAVIAIPVGAFYLHTRGVSSAGMWKAVVVGLIVTGVAVYAAERIRSAYQNRLREAFVLVTKPAPPSDV